MKRIAALAFLLCCSHAAPVPALPAPAVMTSGAEAYARALGVLGQARIFDERAPMKDVRNDRGYEVVRFLFSACRSGLVESCLKLDFYYQGHDVLRVEHDAAIFAADRCVAGDRATCRLLETRPRFASYMMTTDADEQRYLDACRAGDTTSCPRVDEARACVEHHEPTLRCQQLAAAAPPQEMTQRMAIRYCERGLAVICAHLATMGELNGYHLADAEVARYALRACDLGNRLGCERAAELASERGDKSTAQALSAREHIENLAECKGGDWWACRSLDDPRFPALAMAACFAGEPLACERADSVEAKKFSCTGWGRGCDEWLSLSDHRPELEHEILEHGCQWQDLDLCVQLVDGYRTKRFVERTPGRADAIHKFVCETEPKRCAADAPLK